MILYNGASGGLGQYLASSLSHQYEASYALKARLEDQSGLMSELSSLDPKGAVTFIHLAARVSVPDCESNPSAARITNVVSARKATETVVSWALERGASVKVIYVSSGHVYATQRVGARLTEDAQLGPRSVYAHTKWAAEEEMLALASERAVPLLIARVFGLLAPRQAPNYVLPSLIERVKKRELDRIPGLDFARDYLDARDVCENLLLLGSVPWPGASVLVNVCSGVPVTIRDLLRAVLHVLDPADADRTARRATAAPGRLDDVRWLVGDPGAFQRLTGSLPQRIPLSKTVADAVAEA